jgi:hypothetical protein
VLPSCGDERCRVCGQDSAGKGRRRLGYDGTGSGSGGGEGRESSADRDSAASAVQHAVAVTHPLTLAGLSLEVSFSFLSFRCITSFLSVCYL